MSSSLTQVTDVPALPGRDADAHKGRFGRILVVGGSEGMLGAPALVSLSALRSGAGLVTLAVPRSIQRATASLCPCATSVALPETKHVQIAPVPARLLLEREGWISTDKPKLDVLVIGPGVGMNPSRAYARRFWQLVDGFRQRSQVPAVIDADALNLLRAGEASAAGWDGRPHPRTVITPHPGELARMHGVSAKDIQSDREGFAVRTAERMNADDPPIEERAVVVLKGAGTIVTDGQHLYVNTTGNPGMATGGSGDVLSGLLGALIGQRMPVFDAAVAGVYIHGLAGDLAAQRLGQVSMIASDLIDFLPEALIKHNSKRQSNSA